jgi:hypothetical protein
MVLNKVGLKGLGMRGCVVPPQWSLGLSQTAILGFELL